MFPQNSKSVLIGHFYRNPSSNTDWNATFDDQIEKAAEEEKIFLLGHFNKDLLNPQVKSPWLGYINTHDMVQHVNEATRVVPHVSCSTLIHHVYSNFSENIKFIDILKIGLIDHYPIFLYP